MVHQKTVATAPDFVEKLSSVRVDWGENVNLSVKAVGNPTPDLTWLKVKLITWQNVNFYTMITLKLLTGILNSILIFTCTIFETVLQLRQMINT